MNSKIIELLTHLKFVGMSKHIEEVLINAENNGYATEDVLLELLEAEHRERQYKSLNNRIKGAKLPEEWTLDTFPFHQSPNVNKVQIMNLAKLNFMERHENIVFIGNPGTGKSGLAMGLMRQALLNGYRCKFFNAQQLLDELYASLADHKSVKLMKNLFHYDLICIDELGYLNLSEEKVNIFFRLIDLRYRKKPTIITTNLPFEDWYNVFNQKNLVDALLDRIKHFCTVINIGGDSLREPVKSEQDKSEKSKYIKQSKKS
ncbi:MAG TPA: IS21-like element helper ATPase IstB [Flavobacterium sp.]|uniref:IS21-like element helper ATPase IstB n=1 Tax=Flavobacterium sp. TaxID=239 RepID=UPI002ED24985